MLKTLTVKKEERRVGTRETFTESEWNSLTSYLRSYRNNTGIFKNDSVQPPIYVPFLNRVSGAGGLMFRAW